MPKGVYTRRIRPVAERFWSHVDIGSPDECWEWQAYRDHRGYGTFGFAAGDTRWAHRVAWELTNGPIPDGMLACHRCDNPPCCNPGHLFLGSYADNNSDAKAKGRTARGERHSSRTRPESVRRGERHHAAKLTAEQVQEIRDQITAGDSHGVIAARYGVTRSNVNHIARGKSWSGVAS